MTVGLVDDDGSGWLTERFGEAGPELQRLVPDTVRLSHQRFAEAHVASELPGHQVYGNVWLGIGFGGLHVGFGAYIARNLGG